MTFVDRSLASVRALFTEHILAKLFAFIFAVIVVYLVDRELVSTWIDGELVRVVEADKLDATDEKNVALVFEPEADVAILERPPYVRMRVRGPDRQRFEFAKRRTIPVKVKRSWASARPESREYQLDKGDIALGIEGAEIEVLGESKERMIVVDLFEDVDNVPIDLVAPRKLAPGYEYKADDNRFEPRQVTLRGPRSRLAELKRTMVNGKLPLELQETEAPPTPEIAYSARLPAVWTAARISMSPPVVTVRIGMVERQETVARDVDGLEIQVRMGREDLQEVQGGRLGIEFQAVRMQCTVSMLLPRELNDRPTLIEDLRKTLVAEIDLGSFLADGSQGSEGRIPITIRGKPEGAKIVKVDPPTVPITVTRK